MSNQKDYSFKNQKLKGFIHNKNESKAENKRFNIQYLVWIINLVFKAKQVILKMIKSIKQYEWKWKVIKDSL